MNNLWTFGDSFTQGHGCRKSDDYYKKYHKESDTIWPVHLSNLLNVELQNFGVGGYSNDMIFDSIIDNWSKIEKNDYVFIGFTYSHRFDAPINDRLQSMIYGFFEKNNHHNLNNEEIETLINFQYYFSNNILYKDRQTKRIEWIKLLLEEKKCKLVVLWDVQIDLKGLERITQATNGEMKDGHLSFEGHIQLADIFYKKYILNEDILKENILKEDIVKKLI
jgi:hypothetical protein